MMDLAELRINRTPVIANSKCEGCVHYDGNAAAKGGACEVGSAPALCGSGAEPKYGYASLAELGPDEIDDLATPTVNGQIGAMNEYGQIEKMIMMKRVVLGDEDLTIAQRIAGVVRSELVKSIGYAQGQIALHCGAEMARELYEKPLPVGYVVAKSLRDMHFSPRKQKKYGIVDTLNFFKSRGWDVEDSYDVAIAADAIAKSRFGPTQRIKVPTHQEAMQHLAEHNKTLGSGGTNPHPALGADAAPSTPSASAPSAPSGQAGWKPRNRTPTAPMQVVKAGGAANSPVVKAVKRIG